MQKIRVERGLSQKDLSELSGVTVRTIRGYEQGTRPIDAAHLEILCSLSVSLKVRIYDLLESEKLKEKFKKSI